MGDTPITKKEPWGSAVPMSGRQADGSWPVPEVPGNQSLSDQDGNPPPAPPTQSSPLSQPAPSPVTQSPQPDPREPAGEDIFADLPVKKSYLQDLYEKAKLEDPDHAAKVIDIARRLQQPESYVDKNLPEAEKTANQALYDSSFFNELEKEYPGTSEYLSDPKNMAPARDDLENLAQHEKLVRNATEAHGVLENLAAHYQQSVAGLAHKRGLPVFSLLDLAMMAKPLSPTANPTLPESLAGQAGALAGDAVPMGVGGAIGAVAGTPAGPIGQAATSGAAAMALPEAMKQVLAEGGFKNSPEFWTKVFKQAAIGGVTGAAGGLFRTMLGPVAAKMALGGTASQLAGKALETAAPLAGEAGVMTTAGGVAENRQIPAFSPLALLYDALVADKKVKPVDSREYLENLMVVGAMHAAHAGAEPLFDLIRGQKTDDGRALYKAMGDTAEASKLRERLPDAHREFIEQLTKDGPVESIYIPEKKFTEFFQSKGLDPDSVADGLGVTDSLDEARKTGNYVKIPYATWLSKFVDNGFYRELEGDVKFDPHPSAKTPNEQEELRQELKAQYDELEKVRAEGASPAAAQTIEVEKAREDSADSVYQDRYQKFIDAGRTKEEAKANAELHRAILTQFSRETGLSPEELLQRFPLIVERMNEYAPGAGFEQPNLRQYRNAVTWEAIPSTKTGAKIATEKNYAAREAFTEASKGLIISPDGKDHLAEKLGIQGHAQDSGTGGYRGDLNPNVVSGFVNATPVQLNAYARAVQFICRQEAVPSLVVHAKKPAEGHRAVRFTFSQPIDIATQDAFFAELRKSLGDDVGYTKVSPTQIVIVNYPGSSGKAMAEKAFLESLSRLKDEHGERFKIEKADRFGVTGDYGPEHDWESDPEGRDLLRRVSELYSGDPARRSALEAWLLDRRREAEKLSADFDAGKRTYLQRGAREGRGDRQEAASGALRQVSEKEAHPLEGLPASSPGPNGDIRVAARAQGLPARRPVEYVRADPERGKKIADAYEAMAHAPNDPDVKAAYDALIKETLAQYELVKKLGIKVDVIRPGMENPYPEGPRQVLEDIKNGHLWLFPTDLGFGQEEAPDHPLLAMTDEKIGDYPLTANDVFRIVHDVFGHAKEGVGFGPNGEENAWQAHMRMYSPLAARAMTTETRGQNSWVNFGPHGEANRSNQKETIYAPQKAGLLPEWVSTEGLSKEESLFQRGEGEGPRGAIRFEAMPDGMKRAFKSIVTLFNSADRSTIPHESAHYFFEMMGALAQDPETSHAFKKDYETLLKYVGVSSKEELQASHHEKIAEAFEAYLATGRAPSTGLARIFERIKGWFLGIYGDLKKRGVEIPKEVSDVFDRWIATEEEIAHAQGAIGIRSEPIEGVPPEALTRLDDLHREARAQAEAHLMREMSGELSEKRDAFLKSERERLTEKATAEVKEIPLYKAQAELTRYLGKDAVGEAHRFLEERVTDDTAAAFEEMAEREGFGSGEDLAKKLVESDAQNGFQAEVRSRVEAEMKEHAPMMESDAISVEALKLIHNEKTAELLALETEILSGLAGHTVTRTEAAARSRAEAQAMARAAREEAKERIARKPVKEATNAQVYMTAERNAALRAEKALAKGDHEAAAKAKQEQLLNHALATEAVKAKEEATRAIEFLKGAEVKTAEKMPKGFQRQVNEMLSKFGFIAPAEEDLPILTDIARKMAEEGSDTNEVANTTGLILDEESGKWRFETLPEFIERVNNSYYGLVLPDSALHPGKPFRELKLSELLGVEEATKSLIKVGKNYDRFLSAFEKADLVTAAKELRASVEENVGAPYAEKMRLGEPDETKAEKILGFFAELPSAIGRWLDTMLTTCDKLDGLKQDGPAKKYIYRPIEAAENTRLSRTREEMVKLDAIFGKHFKEGELEGYKNTFVDVAGRKVSKEKLLSMLLNWGNEGNRDRVTRGEGLPPEAIEKLLFENLSKRDFDFAQDVWNYLDTFKPEIKKLDLDTKGVETPWVERSPFITPHGRYDGGYYPIAYDHERSASAFLNTEQATELFKTYSGGPAQTDQGHTMARVSTLNRPIRYDMKVLTDHVEDVVHDLSYRRAVIDIARFLTQKDTKAALVNSLGIRGYKAIGDWLKAVASSPSEPLGFGENAARWLRFRTTFYYMGYRIASIPKIAMENLVNVSSELGVSDAARALKNYYFGNSGTHELVVSKSEFMRQRAEHLDRDMGDIYDKWSGKEEGAFYKFAFWTHAFIDQATSFPLWAEMYRRSLAAGADEKLAVEHADEAVKKTFMAGGTTNQPAIMRGSEKLKALTVALGYQNMMWNRYSRQLYEIKQTWRNGTALDAAFIAARSHFYTFLMPAVIGALTEAITKNALHPSPNDEKKQIASHAINEATPLKFIPVARDLFPYFLSKAFSEHGRDLQVTPLERAAQSLLDTAGETFGALGGNRVSEKYPEHVANAISLMVPIPKQLDDIIFNFIDWQKDHGEATWKDAIRRRTKK